MTTIEFQEKIENFPRLPDQECALIIQNYLLEALSSDTYIDWDIVTKFINTPYAGREVLCKLFNSAIRKNTQKIGAFTVGEWIKKYQEQYKNRERNENTFFEYIKNSSEVKSLPERNQLFLARVLRIYDYLLVYPIIDLDGPVSNILRFAMRSEPTSGEMSARTIPEKAVEMRMEKLPIDIAMERYPTLGEQLITSTYIKLKVFPEPARPSIKNWLSDYTFTVGISNHDPIIRGNYLFKGDNARMLSTEDRDKLATIIKSFEEKTPLIINATTKQVIFVSPERKEILRRPAANHSPAHSNFSPRQERREPENYHQEEQISQPQKRFQSDEERISAWRKDLPQKRTAEEENGANNVHFSSPQTFSTEKPPEVPRPIAPNYSSQKSTARINYSTPRPMPKNVVDLREEQ